MKTRQFLLAIAVGVILFSNGVIAKDNIKKVVVRNSNEVFVFVIHEQFNQQREYLFDRLINFVSKFDFFNNQSVSIITGAVIAIIGGIIGQVVNSNLRRKNKRNEYIAELEVNACVWIYPLFKQIMLFLERSDPDFQTARKIVLDNEVRFWNNRLLLPSGVPEAWLYCRNSVLEGKKEEATRWAQIAFPLICKRFGIKEFP
ncbi:MAG: hypothetical protein AAB847_02390 [Patescibacteria group bacterium]